MEKDVGLHGKAVHKLVVHRVMMYNPTDVLLVQYISFVFAGYEKWGGRSLSSLFSNLQWSFKFLNLSCIGMFISASQPTNTYIPNCRHYEREASG